MATSTASRIDTDFEAAFDAAVATAHATIPAMQAVTAPEYWADSHIVATPSGRLAVYSVDAYRRPTEASLLPWSQPVGEIIATVSHRDGSITRHDR